MAGYGTDSDFESWLAGQGLSLPVGHPAIATLRQLGSDYVDSAYEYKLACSVRAGGFGQERAWPRAGHFFNGQSVPDNLIPPQWVHASYRAAFLNATNSGWSTSVVDPTKLKKRSKVSSLEVEFFAPSDITGVSSSTGLNADALINAMVTPWLCSNVRSPNSLFRVI